MNRRDAILREMGLTPVWRLRGSHAAVVAAVLDANPPDADTHNAAASLPVAATQPAAARAVANEPVASAAPAVGDASAQNGVDRMDWAQLREAVANCRACGLCAQRKQAVLGVGDESADWLLIGEAPGADEDEQGEPFVGQAGKLLDNMLAAIDLARGQGVYIANTVKCRPPGNRTPTPEETAACFPFLRRQMALLEPRLVVAMGRPAAQVMLGGEVKIAAARGRVHRHGDLPVIVTYHPAYLLRNLPDKAKAWEDLLFMRQTFRTLAEGQ